MGLPTLTTYVGWEDFTYVHPDDGPIFPLDYQQRNRNATIAIKDMPTGTSDAICVYGLKDEEWYDLTSNLEVTTLGAGNTAYQIKNLVGYEKLYACSEGMFSIPKGSPDPQWTILLDPRI